MIPQVTLIARRGRTPVGELWSAGSEQGATLTVEVIDPDTADIDTGRWAALPHARHPRLALPLEVTTSAGPAVALSPDIGRRTLTVTGDPGPLAALGTGVAHALAALHAAGLGHNAITPSLICATPAGHVQLAVTAACALPLDVAADVEGLRRALADLDPAGYARLAGTHDFALAVTAADLADLLAATPLATSADHPSPAFTPAPPPPPAPAGPPPASLLAPPPPPAPAGPPPASLLAPPPPPAPAGPPTASLPPPQLAPLPPPGGGMQTPRAHPVTRAPRRALPTRPLVIAGGISVALVALAAIAGAATTSSGHTPTPLLRPTSSAVPSPAAAGGPPVPGGPQTLLTPPAAAATVSLSAAGPAVAGSLAAALTPPPPHPTTSTTRHQRAATTAPGPTPAAVRSYAPAATAAPVATSTKPVASRSAPVNTRPVPRPETTTAQPVVTGTVTPPH